MYVKDRLEGARCLRRPLWIPDDMPIGSFGTSAVPDRTFPNFKY